MTKHYLASSFENGLSLVSVEHHEQVISKIETAMKSPLLNGVDVSYAGLPAEQGKDRAVSGDDDFWPTSDSWFAAFRPYKVVDGVCFIPIKGVLLHGVTITFGQYFTGYEYLIRAVQRAEADPMVQRVMFVIHSPGGHVAGCFDTADLIYSMSKPTVAFLADMACSAAYALASQCDKVIGTQTTIAGNIGVLATRIDTTGLFDKMGMKFHYVIAPEGSHKADFMEGNPITKEMLDLIQPEVDETFAIFANCVSRGRKLTVEQIRATQALSYRKDASLEMGLIDSVASSVDVLSVAKGVVFEEVEDVTADTASSAQQEEVEMKPEEMEAKIKDATETATKAATARIGAILGSEEAKGRDELAKHFAFETDMSADAAIAALSKSPKVEAPVVDPTAAAANAAAEEARKKEEEEAAKRRASFDEAMGRTAPNLSPNAEGSEDDQGGDKSLKSTMDLVKSAGLGGYR